MYLDLLQLEDELDEFLLGFGFQLADLKMAGLRDRTVFRVFIDRRDGDSVGIDDCARLAKQVVMWLEMKGVYSARCSLELSSAGVDRVLKRDRDFERYLGQEVKVRHRKGADRVSETGELTSFTDDVLVLTPNEGQAAGHAVSIPRERIEQVNLVPKLEF